MPALFALVAVVAAFSYWQRDAIMASAVDVRNFIMGLEGFSGTAYQDAGGYSIGYGHFITGKETTNDPEELLDQDIAIADAAVSRLVKVPLTPSQRAALVSFVFNVGESQFASSTMLRKLNDGDYIGAASEFDRWTKSQGQTVVALVSRRAQEKALFLS